MKGFILLYLSILFISCSNNGKKEIEIVLNKFIESKVVISELQLIPFQLSDTISFANYIGSKYKIITYVDSISCGECSINFLLKWPELFKDFNTKKTPVLVIFNTSDFRQVQDVMRLYKLDFPYFLDIDGRFQELNPTLPKQKYFHTFLTVNDTVKVAGIPINNLSLRELYINEIYK